MGSQVEIKERIDVPAQLQAGSSPARGRLRAFLVFVLLLSACFFKPLIDLAKYAANEELFSHVFLIPGISFGLIWLERRNLRIEQDRSSPVFAGVLLLVGITPLVAFILAAAKGISVGLNNYLSMTIFAYVCFVVAGGVLILGPRLMKAVAFPAAFLLFMVPFPTFVIQWIEMFFQYMSAIAAHMLFLISGTPVFRREMVFHLPGLVIRVAEECSGIRSSLVLFITSLLAGYLFFRSHWKRCALALLVIPLGILRNGFRIFIISMLSMHVDPNIMNSALHKRGGPIFFVLSLVPFFAILLWLWKLERKRGKA